MRASGIGLPEYCMNNIPRIQEQLAALAIVTQMSGLNLKQSGFHRRGTPVIWLRIVCPAILEIDTAVRPDVCPSIAPVGRV